MDTLSQIPRVDLGRLPYAAAYELQVAHHAEVLAARESGNPVIGRILLVEHDPPVITVSKRAGASSHLLATPELLAERGVTVAETDRGGDITYHGPGQLVVYPIVDLNHLRLGLHDYMRLLESAVIECCAKYGVSAERDAGATGVWVDGSKVCAMGVRVRRWVTMHGLAINVTTNLDHFDLIVPCGLVGRSVTSLSRLLGDACPGMAEVKESLVGSLTGLLRDAAVRARADSAGRA